MYVQNFVLCTKLFSIFVVCRLLSPSSRLFIVGSTTLALDHHARCSDLLRPRLRCFLPYSYFISISSIVAKLLRLVIVYAFYPYTYWWLFLSIIIRYLVPNLGIFFNSRLFFSGSQFSYEKFLAQRCGRINNVDFRVL